MIRQIIYTDLQRSFLFFFQDKFKEKGQGSELKKANKHSNFEPSYKFFTNTQKWQCCCIPICNSFLLHITTMSVNVRSDIVRGSNFKVSNFIGLENMADNIYILILWRVCENSPKTFFKFRFSMGTFPLSVQACSKEWITSNLVSYHLFSS